MKPQYRTWSAFGVAIGLLMLVLACGGNSASPNLIATSPARTDPTMETVNVTTTVIPTATVASPVPQTYNVGDIVRIGDLAFLVIGWQVVPGNNMYQPDLGNRFIGIEMIVVNQGESAQSISSLWQLSLKDAESRKYTPDLGASIAVGNHQLSGILLPGERLRGSVGFAIPEAARGLQLVFDVNMFSSGKVFINLGDDPVMVVPPATIEGERPLTTFPIGEPVTAGEMVLTVHGVSFPEGEQFNRPDEGHRFVLVDVTIENRGSRSQNLSSLMQTWLKDDAGYRYTVDISASILATGGRIDGELAAGESVRGQIGFQVPLDATGLRFVFDPDLVGAEPVSIRLL